MVAMRSVPMQVTASDWIIAPLCKFACVTRVTR